MLKSSLWHKLSWSERNSFLLCLNCLKCRLPVCLSVCLPLFFFYITTCTRPTLVEDFVCWVIEVLRRNFKFQPYNGDFFGDGDSKVKLFDFCIWRYTLIDDNDTSNLYQCYFFMLLLILKIFLCKSLMFYHFDHCTKKYHNPNNCTAIVYYFSDIFHYFYGMVNSIFKQ